LARPPFDPKDENLLPCGSCLICPKRSAAQPMLFPDVVKGDVCMDSGCWGAKAKAHREAIFARAIAGGRKVLRETAAIFWEQGATAGLRGSYASHWVILDNPADRYGTDRVTYRQIFEGLAKNPKAKPAVEAIMRKVVATGDQEGKMQELAEDKMAGAMIRSR